MRKVNLFYSVSFHFTTKEKCKPPGQIGLSLYRLTTQMHVKTQWLNKGKQYKIKQLTSWS